MAEKGLFNNPHGFSMVHLNDARARPRVETQPFQAGRQSHLLYANILATERVAPGTEGLERLPVAH